MAQYKVISSRLAEFEEGSTISDSDLAGMNVQALIDGEHLAIVHAKSSKNDDKDK